MLSSELKRVLAASLMGLTIGFVSLPAGAATGERKIKVEVKPAYPELARRMAVSGSVKLEVTVAPNGTVKNVKVVGGHPLLIDSAVDAVKRWKYEAAPQETTQVVEFKFSPNE